MNSDPSYGVIILAGGKSERMGSPKPWLKLKATTFLEHLVKSYADYGIDDIVCILNNEFYSDDWKNQIKIIEKHSTLVINSQVEKGRLYSIKLGLEKLSDQDFVFIQNIDNPFTSTEILDVLKKKATPRGVSIPAVNGKGGHPVLISNSVGKFINDHPSKSTTLHDVFDNFEREYVEVENEDIFKNLNTPEDYRKALSEFVQTNRGS